MKYLVLFLTLALTPDPGDIAKINRLKKEAKSAFVKGDYQLAIEKYTFLLDSMDVREQEDEIKTNLAHAYFNMKDTASARSAYQALTSSENNTLKSISHQQLGVMNRESNQLESALREFKSAIKANPRNRDARYNYEVVKKLLEQKKNQQQEDQQNQDENQDNQKENKEKNKEKNKEEQQKDQKEDQKEEKGKQDQQQEKKEGEKNGEEEKNDSSEKGGEKQKKQEEQQGKEQQEKQDQQEGEEQKDQQKGDQQEENAEQKGDKKEGSEGENAEKEEKKEEGKKPGGEEKENEKAGKEEPSRTGQEGEGEKSPEQLTSEKLKEMNLSEEKVKMILEAMKNNEVQYLQQRKKTSKKRPPRNKPDW